jgi:hypothetical protein
MLENTAIQCRSSDGSLYGYELGKLSRDGSSYGYELEASEGYIFTFSLPDTLCSLVNYTTVFLRLASTIKCSYEWSYYD